MKNINRTVSIIILIIIIIVIYGCVPKTKNSDYPIAIMWGNSVYGLSIEEVYDENLAEQIGEVIRVKEPMPEKNGDANFIPIGSKVFRIKSIDIKDAIAVEKNGTTYKATILQNHRE
ncbi:MAG: hypothetical protein ACOZCL_19280 [Bacillota bacterium]